MIERIIKFSIYNKLIIGLFAIALVGWGFYSLTKLPIDAVPDITNNQVQIISVAPTLAANEVEKYITAPIEISVANIPDKIELRSISRLGLSVVTIVFKDNVDFFRATRWFPEDHLIVMRSDSFLNLATDFFRNLIKLHKLYTRFERYLFRYGYSYPDFWGPLSCNSFTFSSMLIRFPEKIFFFWNYESH